MHQMEGEPVTPELVVEAILGGVAVVATNVVCYRSLRKVPPMDEHTRVLALKIASIRGEVRRLPYRLTMAETEEWIKHIEQPLREVQEALSPSQETVP
jgi:hypothetical protein